MLVLSLSFALLQCFVGVGLILIAVYIMLLDKKAVIFFWLGLFALATGVWAFGENNFTHIVFKNTAALYLLSFIGFFTFMIPLLRFVSLIVNFKDPRPIRYTELGLTFCAALALLLQLFGLVSCSSSMYVFHIILPVILVLLTVLTAREATRYHNRNARRMLLPIGVLVLSAVLELCNYRFLFTLAFSSVFQVGIITFLLCMGIIGGLFIKDSLDLKDRQKELAFEKSLVNIQIKEQKERGFLLAHKEQILRQQRHDLRHHLAAIQELAWEENTELQNYLKTLMDQIPKPEERFCENRAVNAVIAHYVQICDTSGINFTVRLVVPPCGDGISDNELCVIFGNLLENAVEACNRLVRGPRFIKLNSSLQFNILTITMDNSFTGELITENGRFRSAKRDDYGIGIASIQSVAEKYSGDAEFKSSGKVFFSSVYLTI